MTNTHRISTMQLLPPLSKIYHPSPKEFQRQRISDTSNSTTVDSRPSSPIAAFPPNHVPHPPQCERSSKQPKFRCGRLSPSLPMSAEEVYDAIVTEVPDAKVAHVYHDSPSNLIPISSRLDFGKAFGSAVPSFILVDGHEECITLASQMLKSQSGKAEVALVVVIIEQPAFTNCKLVIESVPDFVNNGADDIMVIPVGAKKIEFCISACLAKAKASRRQKINFKRQLQRATEQWQGLFWNCAHILVPGIPQLEETLIEKCDKQVGDAALGSKLGEGAFGSVYTFEHEEKKSRGAVKIIRKGAIRCVKEVEDIATELIVLQSLDHQNVVALESASHGTQNIYLFMEMAGTRSLFRVIREQGAHGMQWSRTQGFLAQIAAGLFHCHERAVAHCDLKPENIVVSPSGCAKLVDFGKAVDLEQEVLPLQAPRGTMPFMAPEVMCMSPDWNPAAADMWSLGVVVVEMLCGNHAFVKILGWQGKDLNSWSGLSHRANDLKIFCAKEKASGNANALSAVSGFCRDVPPPCAIQLINGMLTFTPESRTPADCVVQLVSKATEADGWVRNMN
mmetsp:Transcript_112474/g.198511  ORF Transcript_112474/g.198511 Transcript_112474/m.198511 type:complete len:563 (+) Transcript_112474:101-1789(+)